MKAAHVVIAIDGPAASGKSSVARALAQELGFIYVNTGAMYRAVTWHLLREGVDVRDPAQVCGALNRMELVCAFEAGEMTLRINGADPMPHLTEARVNDHVSPVSGVSQVRTLLVARQREFLAEANLVMEGRDIGSVVFPQTPFKFYIDASPEVRAGRRAAQGFQDAIQARDSQDSSRKHSPLTVAPDAQVIDSSSMSVVEVVQEILHRLQMKGLAPN